MLGELNDTQINSILTSQVVGRLACTDGKQPYVVPATYAPDGKYIYGQTNAGTKLKMLRKNPNVCFQIEMMTDMRNWKSVLAYGKFEELKDQEAEKAREILYNLVFPLSTSSTIHLFGHDEKGIVDDSTRVKTVMYRIKIKKVTGRFENQQLA